MAEIILEPTVQSKVIPLPIRLNDTDASLVSQLVTNRQFSTADTDAWFSFTLEGLAATTGTFDLTLINLHDKSVFNHTDKVFNTNPFYYKLDSGTDELTNEIRHAGKWVGQLVVTLANGDSATRKFIFGIEGHILDGTVVQTILLEDYNALIATITGSKDELLQYNIDYATLIADVTTAKETMDQAEITRQATFDALVDSEMVAQNVATKLTEKEATFAPRMLSLESELAEIEQSLNAQLVQRATKEEVEAERARINNIVAPDGDPSLTEVSDIRVSANGTTYGSAGEAVRNIGNGKGIIENAIRAEHLEFSQKTSNLFNRNAMLDGYKLNGTNGSVEVNATQQLAPFMNVSPNVTIYWNQSIGTTYVYWYDINKTFISRIAYNSNAGATPPSNAYYVRFNTAINNVGFDRNTFMVKTVKDFPEYVPYAFIPVSDTIKDYLNNEHIVKPERTVFPYTNGYKNYAYDSIPVGVDVPIAGKGNKTFGTNNGITCPAGQYYVYIDAEFTFDETSFPTYILQTQHYAGTATEVVDLTDELGGTSHSFTTSGGKKYIKGIFKADLSAHDPAVTICIRIQPAAWGTGTVFSYKYKLNKIYLIPCDKDFTFAKTDLLPNLNYYPHSNYLVTLNAPSLQTQNKRDTVVIGDSISNQIANRLTSINPNGGSSFVKYTHGGETVLDTMARLGAIPWMILPTTIPASGSTGALTVLSSIFLKTSFDPSTARPTYSNGFLSNYGSTGIYPYDKIECTINGIEGTLYFERSYGTNYFTRKTAGTAVTIDSPVLVIPNDLPDKNSTFIAFMGTNGGWDSRFWSGEALGTLTEKDADFLVTLYERIAEWSNYNYLFLGFYSNAGINQKDSAGINNWWNYFEEKMLKTFGLKYFSTRQYLMAQGYKDLSKTLTANDIADILSGKIPYEASTGSQSQVHLTDKMSGAVANKVLERLHDLEYINTYTKIDLSTLTDGEGSSNPDDYN